MLRLRRLLFAGGCVALPLLCLTLTPTGPAVAQGLKNVLVQVANTPDDPVPTYDVHNPACMPFQIQLFMGPASGQDFEVKSFTVPRDKRLVIEHVSLHAFGQGFLRTQIKTTANGTAAQHVLVSEAQGSTLNGNVPVWRASQPTRWYADPGTEVEVNTTLVPPSGAVTSVTISGYLVDCGVARSPVAD